MIFKSRLTLLTPLILAVIFSLWRTFGYKVVGISDFYFNQVDTTLKVLLSRLLLGYKVNLIWGWTTAILRLFPWFPSAKYAFIVLVGLILILWFSLSTIIFRNNFYSLYSGTASWPLKQRLPTLNKLVLVGLAGLVLIGAGYIPIITVFQPNLAGLSSRVNIFSSLGSTVFILTILFSGSLLLSKNQHQTPYLFLASVTPFIILGVFTQISVQYDTRIAWEEQKTIWQDLFSIAPNFKDNTKVLFILPGYQDRTGYQNWKRLPLSSSWEVSSAVRLLYNNPTLSGDVLFPDIIGDNEPSLIHEGIITKWSNDITPYTQVAAFIYDNNTGVLHQLDELPANLVPEEENPVKLATGRVLDEKILNTPLRKLVEQ
jgi:hypothetical protein